MSQQQLYLANALACARRREDCTEPGERLQHEKAEAAWLVLAGIEPAPEALATPIPCRKDYRPGWSTG
jgi:hypothetical protein